MLLRIKQLKCTLSLWMSQPEGRDLAFCYAMLTAMFLSAIALYIANPAHPLHHCILK
jgi:hypothetical protein